MGAGFSAETFAFNANQTLPAAAALGIFPAAQYATYANPYGEGGDDTAAVQAAINAAHAAGGAVAYLTPPSSGAVNVSSELVLPTGTWLVGASPGVVIQSTASLDWILANGTASAVDYRTVMAINYRSQTLGGNSYTTYDPSRPAYLTLGGGLMNLTFSGLVGQSTGLGHGVMLNAARSFGIYNCFAQNCIGEGTSLWDCSYLTANGIQSTSCGRAIGVHRATYDVGILNLIAISGTAIDVIVYTEQFQVPNGPLLTLTPSFTKFVEAHRYGSLVAAMIDLGGPVFINLSGVTADNISGSTPYQSETRFGSVPYEILADTPSVPIPVPVADGGTGTATPTGVSAGTGISVTGSFPAQIVTLTTPVSVANGGTGTATPALIAGTGITITGSFPAQTITLTTPVSVADGGTGTATPALIGGTGISISGTWPDQTVTNTEPGTLALSGLTTDVLISSPSDGQVLQYVAAASKWENKPSSAGAETQTTLTFSSSSTTLAGQTVWPSNQTLTFTSGHRVIIRALVFRNGTGTTLNVMLSSDGSHAYHFAAQGDGNLVNYYYNGTTDTSIGTATGGGTTDFAGWQEMTLEVICDSVNGNTVWGSCNNLYPKAGTNSAINMTSGTFTVYVGANAFGSIGPAYASVL